MTTEARRKMRSNPVRPPKDALWAERVIAGHDNAAGMLLTFEEERQGRIRSRKATGLVMPHPADVRCVFSLGEYNEASHHWGQLRFADADDAMGRAVAAEEAGGASGSAAAGVLRALRERMRQAAAGAQQALQGTLFDEAAS